MVTNDANTSNSVSAVTFLCLHLVMCRSEI